MSEICKIGPCALVYDSSVVGVVVKGPTLKFESGYSDIICDQAFDQPVGKYQLSSSVTLQADVRQIDTGMDLLLDSDGCITADSLGGNVSEDAAELLLVPLSLTDTIGYRMPQAILLKKTQYSFLEEDEHSIQLEFEAQMDDSGILLEKFTVSDDQRVDIDTTEIDPGLIESALTEYFAGKLEITVDSDIFRGGIPFGIDGCCVELSHELLSNSTCLRTIRAVVECLSDDRDYVFNTIQTLSGYLPAYGATVSVDSDSVDFLSITKLNTSFKRVSDSGRIKTSGQLDIEVKL